MNLIKILFLFSFLGIPFSAFSDDSFVLSETKEKIISKELDQFEKHLNTNPESSKNFPLRNFQINIDNNPINDSLSNFQPPHEEVSFKSLKQPKRLSHFDLAFEGMRYRYAEPNFVKLHGIRYGVSASYVHRLQENLIINNLNNILGDVNKINVVKVDGRFSRGNLSYRSEGTGTTEDVEDFLFEYRLLFGYDLSFNSTFRLTPYLGFGLRHLYNDSRGQTSTGANGYRRRSNYFYLPIALELQQKISSNWSMEYSGEYDIFLSGKQYSYLSDANSGYNDVKNNQDKGYGLKGEIKIIRNFDDFDFFIEPFAYYWDIEDSDISSITFNGTPVSSGREPANNTTEYGCKIGFRY